MSVTVTGLDWERVARAAMHPLAIDILERLVLGGEYSPSELAGLFEEPVPNVSYHVRQLGKRGLVRLVRTEPRRGAVEHFYEVTP